MVRALFIKDVRLTKKNLPVMIVFIIGMPVFLNWNVSGELEVGAVPLLIMVNILGIILYGNICMEEEKYPGGEIALLCAPCSKKILVAVRYLIMSAFFLICTAGYEAVALVMGRKLLYIWQILQAMSVYIILMGIFIPIVYKTGVIRVQYILSGTVVLLGFAVITFTNSEFFISMTEFLNRNRNLAAVCFIGFCIAFTSVSYIISLKIYEKKECS